MIRSIEVYVLILLMAMITLYFIAVSASGQNYLSDEEQQLVVETLNDEQGEMHGSKLSAITGLNMRTIYMHSKSTDSYYCWDIGGWGSTMKCATP